MFRWPGTSRMIRAGDGLATIRANSRLALPGVRRDVVGPQSVQTQGSLRDGGLAALLQTMQAERATGTLALENGTDSASLYFLFGHLFHASGPGGQGEDVVVEALSWQDGTYQFDPRAKLPAEETIKSSPQELIATAENRQGAAVGAAAPASTAEAGWGDSSGLRVLDSAGSADPSAPSVPDEPAFEPAAPAPSFSEPHATQDDSGLASWTAAQHDVSAPPEEPLSYPTLPEEPAP